MSAYLVFVAVSDTYKEGGRYYLGFWFSMKKTWSAFSDTCCSEIQLEIYL